jgi:hypothetical protein
MYCGFWRSAALARSSGTFGRATTDRIDRAAEVPARAQADLREHRSATRAAGR